MDLKVRNLSVRFGQVRAVNYVTLTVRQGEIVAIFGANGSGKTTFLKAIAGLIPVAEGRITYHGEDITHLHAHERVARGVHYVSDRARVALRMTVRENLDVGGYLRTAAERDHSREKVHDLFPVLKVKERDLAGVLSGGERQMLVIGRALMGNPSLLLFDQPVSASNYAGLIKAKLIDGALASLAAAGVAATVFSDVLADPPELPRTAVVLLVAFDVIFLTATWLFGEYLFEE